jgi:hypothetical protein
MDINYTDIVFGYVVEGFGNSCSVELNRAKAVASARKKKNFFLGFIAVLKINFVLLDQSN